MIRLLFIVPYPELKEKVKAVLESHPDRQRMESVIQVMTVEETPDIPADDYDAIIARGYMARKTKVMYPQTPTIDLAISGYDIIRTITECQEKFHPHKIAICGFYGKFYEAKNVCRLLGCDAEVYTPCTHEELEQTMKDAAAKGYDAVIGGYSANLYARKYGIPSIVIKTGEDTIFQALNETIRVVDGIRQERIRAEMYKTIIYTSKDGVLYVDGNGIIQVRNRVAKSMYHNGSLQNRSLLEAFPFLYETFREVASDGQEVRGRIYTLPGSKTNVSACFSPVIVKKEISGVVINLSDITMIQDLEGQIRRKLSEKGLRAKYTFDDIIYESQIVRSTIETAKKYAASDSNVIIVGETGTGKELFAQSIHNESTRKNGPFVAINCAALPENLLESELFGYVEGAFTGTVKGGKMGLFEQAHGGTLFLDEIGEISLPIQTKLLRVLQEREVRRIGDNKVISVNVRVISATNKSIGKLAEQGDFRKDLMYRLDVLRVFLPPLRQRGSDVELLFHHLLMAQAKEAGIKLPSVDTEALAELPIYGFWGNIRELKNIVERACVLCSGNRITRQDILNALYPRDLEESQKPASAENTYAPLAVSEARSVVSEREALMQALEECGGNQSKAARKLGIDRSTLWRKMRKYQMKP